MLDQGPAEAGGVTIVIPTRDRGAGVVTTIESIFASDSPTQLIVVDQSTDDSTQHAVEPWLSNRAFRYIRSDRVGIAAGLNAGIEAAQTDLIAITGDDCRVEPLWLERLAASFKHDPRTGVVFGNVHPGLADPGEGFTPSYVRDDAAVADHVRDKHKVGGTSACMAVRRRVWADLEGFDEMLGVGAPLRSAEETDFTIRALMKGHRVREVPGAIVIHDGYFSYSDRAALIRRNWYGTGAAFVKPFKLGRLDFLAALVRLALRWSNNGSKVAAGMGVGAHRIDTLRAFLHGAWAGIKMPVDRDSGHFVEPR